MKLQWKSKISVVAMILLAVLCIYFGGICLINLVGRPSFYNTDMYADMIYAREAWKHKTLFPENWLFGNQLYVVATPALAALFCGLPVSIRFAMGLAATVMGIFVVISFDWMMKPAIKSLENRLFAVVFFMTLVLFFGDSVGTENGWQLFFTMCAYYSCYAINAFLAFGCYIRAHREVKRGFWFVVALSCILAFCTGMQSLRQTAVMSIPLMAVACLQVAADWLHKRKWKVRPLAIAASISVSNILGAIYVKTIEVNQTEIFGQVGLNSFTEIISAMKESVVSAMGLLACETSRHAIVLAGIIVVCIFSAVEFFHRKKTEYNFEAEMILILLVLSILAVMGIDVVTTVLVRPIYYFMLYPLIAFLVTRVFQNRGENGRLIVLAAMLVALVFPSVKALKDICMQAYFGRYDSSYAVSAYLMENNYTTVYSAWNHGEDIAIASEFEIDAGFWDTPLEPFKQMKYLCDPEVYEADHDRCVYLFKGLEGAELAVEAAKTRNVEMSMEKYFPESNIYIYSAPINLMQSNDSDLER